MNIVYLLTNTSKQSGARFYIGSKTECSIITLDGIPTIISLKDNKPYYSSSQNQTFIEDFKKGDVFVASLLEEVPNRDLLLSVENKYILENKAVESEELEEIIAKDIIDLELGFKECAKKQGMTVLNVQRYFLRYTRKRLKSNDL